jgi:2',3'-cyclic-nucleotide 2'-phosphodiesterase
MKILYIGDIYGEPGMSVVEQVLPGLKRQYSLDLVVAQAENVSDGRGINKTDYARLKKIGIDFFTGGNWSLAQDDILPMLNDPAQPIIRPANYPAGTPGLGYKYAQTKSGRVLVISLLGKVVGRDADKPTDNPLKIVDDILTTEKATKKVATIINFHGDYSSEKLVVGFYLDGRASAVVGDHWHIPTADPRLLPNGTAHITDVGMCGTLNSSIGVKTDIIIKRWRDDEVLKNEVETAGPLQFNAVLIEVNQKTGLAQSIEQIQKVVA